MSAGADTFARFLDLVADSLSRPALGGDQPAARLVIDLEDDPLAWEPVRPAGPTLP